jgi:DNA invertase Pin-like site-specific DNA recombinase
LTSDLVHSRPLTRLPAAQYIRMSTEHQNYSPENQLEAIAAYASLFSMDVVQTYSDLGKSGLKLANRPGLKALLDDVETRRNGFRVVLVFDVSRWGRFQDADESAYYEYVLKKAGVHVHYCAEHFTNDGSLSSVLLKALKRTMAGEYSRELSIKVFAGQKRQVELGFHQGGHAGYGLRRQLVDVDGNNKGILQLGEWKCLQSDRVILVPGPQLELDVVAGIYRSYINGGMTETEIRNDLNARGIETTYDRLWTLYDVHKVLSSPKYTGVNVFNRRSFKLGQKRVRNSPDLWIRCPDAFQAIVSSEDFQKAQTLIAARSRKWEADAMLDKLKALLKVSGRLTAKIIDAAQGMPSSVTYSNRFGGLGRAYALAGWQFERDLTFVVDRKRYKGIRKQLLEPILKNIVDSGGTYRFLDRFGLLSINDELTVCIRIVRSVKRQRGTVWRVAFGRPRPPDIWLVARLYPQEPSILDYFILPSCDFTSRVLFIGEQMATRLASYRFDTLEPFLNLCRPRSVQGVS